MTRLLAVATLLAVSAGCDSADTDPGCIARVDPACTPPAEDEVVAGVNLTALFAAPTAAERDSVAARLARTSGTSASPVASVEAAPLSTDPDGTRYQLVTLRDSVGAAVLHALARIPSRDGGPATALPTVLLVPDGPGDASEAMFLTGATAGGLDREAVQVVAAFRGATLTGRGRTVTSEVPADPYRADVVDLLALAARLNVVDRASPTRVAVVGLGRGGAVALLAAERAGNPFSAVSSLGAPTSLFDATFRTTARLALLGQPSRLPAAESLLAPVFAFRDGTIDFGEARLQLLELSAVALADQLPATLAFHAVPDDIVPSTHLDRLREEGEGTLQARRRFVPVPDGLRDALLFEADVRADLVPFLFSAL